MKYRKKTDEVEAFKYDGGLKGLNGQYYVPDWAVKAYEEGKMYYGYKPGQTDVLFVETSFWGGIPVLVGDYVVCDADGDMFVTKADVFEKTYEVVEE